MKTFNKLLAVVIVSALYGTNAMAVNTVQGEINLSGNVPDVFSMRVTQSPGELDLTPGISIVNRSIGQLHLRYNIDIDEILITPDLATTPAYPLWTDTALKAGIVCDPTVMAAGAKAAGGGGGGEILTVANASIIDLVATGYEADCLVTLDYATAMPAAGTIPLAGEFTLGVAIQVKSE